MSSKSFWDHPIEKIEEALSIRKQIATLQDKLKGLFGSDDEPAVKSTSSAPAKRGGKRKMSAATIAKMRASQQARWANKRSATGGVVSPLDTLASSSKGKAAKPAKKKRNLTPEGRARLSAAMKARHAAKKAAK